MGPGEEGEDTLMFFLEAHRQLTKAIMEPSMEKINLQTRLARAEAQVLDLLRTCEGYRKQLAEVRRAAGPEDVTIKVTLERVA